jgi:hypothetical protein
MNKCDFCNTDRKETSNEDLQSRLEREPHLQLTLEYHTNIHLRSSIFVANTKGKPLYDGCVQKVVPMSSHQKRTLTPVFDKAETWKLDSDKKTIPHVDWSGGEDW